MLPPPAMQNPNTPSAFARSPASVKRPMISESATAETTAPPSPCTARAPTSIPWLVERPQTIEAAVKSVIPSEEQPALPEQVAEPAAEQQEAAEGQQVGVHHPRERGLGEAEIVARSTAVRRSRSKRRRRSSGRPDRGRGGRSSVRVRCRGSSGLLSVSTCSTRSCMRKLIGHRPMSFCPIGRSLVREWMSTRAPSRPTPGLPRPARAAPPPRRAVPGRLAGTARPRPLLRARACPRPRTSSGSPKSGKSRAVSRKKVMSTTRPSRSSSTCSAHGS